MWSIALHGGAGTIERDTPVDIINEYIQSLNEALQIGINILEKRGSALDCVEAVVKQLEDDPHFNAGKGSVLDEHGNCEMDASIMNGETLKCAAITGVKSVKNPILLTRLILERSDHIMFHGEGAEKLAQEYGVERVPQEYFKVPKRILAWEKLRGSSVVQLDHNSGLKKDFGTVGCVARDVHGNVCSATSTGGLTNKKKGRVGDTPIIGAGTYANNSTCAVSSTGKGEEFIRHMTAFDIHARMAYKGLTLKESAFEVIHTVMKEGNGGVVSVAQNGDIVMDYNSVGMFRAAANNNGLKIVKIWE